jgi:hypothetical protein
LPYGNLSQRAGLDLPIGRRNSRRRRIVVWIIDRFDKEDCRANWLLGQRSGMVHSDGSPIRLLPSEVTGPEQSEVPNLVSLRAMMVFCRSTAPLVPVPLKIPPRKPPKIMEGSLTISSKTVETTCHETPYLSLSDFYREGHYSLSSSTMLSMPTCFAAGSADFWISGRTTN